MDISAGRFITVGNLDEVEDEGQFREEPAIFGEVLHDERVFALVAQFCCLQVGEPFPEESLCLTIEAEERIVRELLSKSAVIAEVHVSESLGSFEYAVFRFAIRVGIDVLFPARNGVGIYEQLEAGDHAVDGEVAQVINQQCGLDSAKDTDAKIADINGPPDNAVQGICPLAIEALKKEPSGSLMPRSVPLFDKNIL